MPALLLFNKPYRVLSQFTDSSAVPAGEQPRRTLADYIDQPHFYPAGRLDFDSEGLLLLTDNGELQARIANPKFKLEKSYWVQVEGHPGKAELDQMRAGLQLNDGPTRPAKVSALQDPPTLWPRLPALAAHRDKRSSWLDVALSEGRNRQVRRMCAAIGHPVLRLVRHRIGPWQLEELQPGETALRAVNIPTSKPRPARSKHARKSR